MTDALAVIIITNQIQHMLLPIIAGLFLASGGLATEPDCKVTVYSDAIVRDGLGSGPKDGLGDEVLDESPVQALNVPQFEDRAILEFRLPPCQFTTATLELTTFTSHGPYPQVIDIYGYVGDGAVTTSDFNAGARIASFAFDGEPTVFIDITAFVASHATSKYLGLALRQHYPSSIVLNGPFVAFNSQEYPPPALLHLTAARAVPISFSTVLLAGVALLLIATLRLKA